jgi:two-component system sensor histidine kinase KdpD
VKEIHVAAERLNRLVANLLDMTRLESGMIQPKMDWCDLRDVLNHALKNLERELDGHAVSVDVSDEVPLMKLDFGLIEQALTNLVHNAALHTPVGTDISIRSYLEEGETCVISVADNGPGLPREDLNKVFEKFYRAQNGKSGGTGLGLTIAKGFIEAHHGTITARNRTDGGAEFVVRLPITEAVKNSTEEII